MRLKYPLGIDKTAGTRSTRLEPIHIPPPMVIHLDGESEEEHHSSSHDVQEDTSQELASVTSGASIAVENQDGNADASQQSSTAHHAKATSKKVSSKKGPLVMVDPYAHYDRADVDSPWNRYLEYNRLGGEKGDLGYQRHLNFHDREFTAGQVLAARKKEQLLRRMQRDQQHKEEELEGGMGVTETSSPDMAKNNTSSASKPMGKSK